jgi:hypothetical protein
VLEREGSLKSLSHQVRCAHGETHRKTATDASFSTPYHRERSELGEKCTLVSVPGVDCCWFNYQD